MNRLVLRKLLSCGNWSFLLLLSSSSSVTTAALVFLQDLPTPSFVIDLQAVQKALGRSDASIPPIALPSASLHLVAAATTTVVPAVVDNDRYLNNEDTTTTLVVPPWLGGHPPCHTFDPDLTALDLFSDTAAANGGSNAGHDEAAAAVCYGYIHTRVVRSRHNDETAATAATTATNSFGNFLAQVDAQAPTDVTAHLVLGLHHHHVVSYYWARAAGSGAAMEAPGIVFDGPTGVLQWAADAGFTACNSNDGKRSEWVNFLRVGDTVQLRPLYPEAAAVLSFVTSGRGIYGVSSAGRPLGSEPVVVCQWQAVPSHAQSIDQLEHEDTIPFQIEKNAYEE